MPAYRLDSTKETAIRTWIVAALNGTIPADKIIWEDENAPRPAPPYVALRVTAGPVRLGGDDAITHLTGDNFQLKGHRQITLSIKTIGLHDMAALSLVQNSVHKPTVHEGVLRPAGLAIARVEPPVDLSLLVESGQEPRMNMDVLLMFATTTTDAVGYISKVEFEGKVASETFPFEAPLP